ncbi:MAG: 50S ribosomal protein L4 [Gammaproteobacteria bacterium]|nr:50S ribosomal protein L4 [Gammaproteobacteria bacterium]MBT8133398.1 50S ribosomal protein L4 [Gammaproteobacteria bacterium]NNJ50399.1 50S ribosomal protein L4 [Gammaproteobacteria bacterium]
MDLQLHNSKETIAVSDAVFGLEYKESLIHQLVTAYMAAGRAGTVAQKNRSAVRGGGAKPWNQKGSGRARAGTSRSPLWRSGGATFAAQPRDYTQKLNKKMYRTGIRSMLSELNRQQRLVVVEDITVDAPKTKQMAAKLADLGVSKTLIVTETGDESLYLSARNLPYVEVTDVAGMNPVNLARYDHVVVTVGAVRAIEESLGGAEGDK